MREALLQLHMDHSGAMGNKHVTALSLPLAECAELRPRDAGRPSSCPASHSHHTCTAVQGLSRAGQRGPSERAVQRGPSKRAVQQGMSRAVRGAWSSAVQRAHQKGQCSGACQGRCSGARQKGHCSGACQGRCSGAHQEGHCSWAGQGHCSHCAKQYVA